jgi:alkanesulfonate monooxygenase SsuD/methylene tetrahydromethanopterin reductase-like flavin-dependent oxidoreductase (luciferase family)
MQLGLTLNPTDSPQRVCEVVRKAERYGFDFCYVADQGFQRDVFVTLTAVLAETDRIRVGAGVTNPLSRSLPSLLATARSLKAVGRERVFMGLGMGGSRVLKPLRITRHRALASLEVAIIACKGCGIPVHVAGRGPRVLAMAGRLADEIIVGGDGLARTMAALRVGYGDDRPRAPINWSVFIAPTPATREAMRQRIAYSLADSPKETYERFGLTETDVQTMAHTARVASLAEADSVIVSDDPQAVTRTIQRTLREHAMDSPVLVLPTDLSLADEQLDFVKDVIPRLLHDRVSTAGGATRVPRRT